MLLRVSLCVAVGVVYERWGLTHTTFLPYLSTPLLLLHLLHLLPPLPSLFIFSLLSLSLSLSLRLSLLLSLLLSPPSGAVVVHRFRMCLRHRR